MTNGRQHAIKHVSTGEDMLLLPLNMRCCVIAAAVEPRQCRRRKRRKHAENAKWIFSHSLVIIRLLAEPSLCPLSSNGSRTPEKK